jgi:Cu+-exporting ATPase
MEKIDTLVVDKTGTLTEGRPRLTDLVSFPPFTDDQMLRLAASVEQNSEHPIGGAIVQAARERDMELAKVIDFDSATGGGVRGTIDGKSVYVGTVDFLQEQGVNADPNAVTRAADLQRAGRTVMFVAIDRQLSGLLAVADPIKSSSPEAIRRLHGLGLVVVMLTGDNEHTAGAVAEQLGIDRFEARLKPADKLERINRLRSEGHVVAMAGDGINDAPALAAADVGIAMGTGTDVAIQSAGITLVKGDLRGIVRAVRLSRKTMRNIRQNLFFAFVYNLLGVPIAAGVLVPIFGMSALLSPMIAAAAMSFSSVSVIANALRLRAVGLD